MSKNRIGQNSMETIWQKSRWREAVDKLKNNSYTNFSLKNGYPSQPPSYREYDSPTLPQQREDRQPLTANKRMKDVSCCLKATNYIIGIFLLISLILSTVGATTSYWLDTGTLNVGLFKVCTKSSTCDPVSSFTESASATTPNTWRIVTGLDISGCCILLLCLIFYCIFVHCTVLDYRKVSCGVLLCILVMLSAGGILSGMAVMVWYYFDIDKIYSLDWSFYVAASGGGLAFITFCIMIVYIFALAFE
ncbi:unnamed protein product [Mytilus coruscus]|uniref:Uncharacterized protein n=1 Tax=Mytilus coruscus TaxID=42192 RepID=A0A6J8C0R8_MYTCO|nr:unnamed protein product [Mytilus coruscus]